MVSVNRAVNFKTMTKNKWVFTNQNNDPIEFTAENFTNYLSSLSDETQVPITQSECDKIVADYKRQLNRTVRVYYDGKRNVTEFI